MPGARRSPVALPKPARLVPRWTPVARCDRFGTAWGNTDRAPRRGWRGPLTPAHVRIIDLVSKPVFGLLAASILLCGAGHWADPLRSGGPSAASGRDQGGRRRFRAGRRGPLAPSVEGSRAALLRANARGRRGAARERGPPPPQLREHALPPAHACRGRHRPQRVRPLAPTPGLRPRRGGRPQHRRVRRARHPAMRARGVGTGAGWSRGASSTTRPGASCAATAACSMC